MNTPNNYDDNDSGDEDLEYREEWLSAYLDDELNAAQRALVEQRIVDDEQAAVMLQDLMRVRSLVGSLPAWSGNSLSLADITRKHSAVFSDELAVLDDGEANEGPLVDQANAQGNDGDYHNELNPDTQLALSSASIAGALERDIAPDFSRGSRTGQPTRRSNIWLRPALLAASLLFALGIGFLLWPSNSPWSLATSTSERAPANQSGEPTTGPVAPSSDSAPAMMSDESGAGMPTGGISAQGMPAPIVIGPAMAADKAVPEQMAPFSMRESSDSRGQTSGSNKERAKSQLETQSMEKRNAPAENTTPVPTPLQLARSSAWTDSDLSAGVIRLSQFLNFSPAMKSKGISNVPRLKESSVGSTIASATTYPIAIVTRKHSEREGSQLTTLLQQSNFGLAGISDVGPSVEVPGQVPFGAATDSIPPTIVLFVDRGQAQRILQAADQAGEVIGKPLWVSSVDDLGAADNAAQKVVLLISPR